MKENPMQGKQNWLFIGGAIMALLAALLVVLGIRRQAQNKGNGSKP